MSNVRRKYPKLIVNEQPKSPISEKFRGIRSNILFASADDPIKSVVVTSDGPGSGKSTTSANLAISFAQAGYKTILIDGDMRKRHSTIFLSCLIMKDCLVYYLNGQIMKVRFNLLTLKGWMYLRQDLFRQILQNSLPQDRLKICLIIFRKNIILSLLIRHP